jgi:hypothetical protein
VLIFPLIDLDSVLAILNSDGISPEGLSRTLIARAKPVSLNELLLGLPDWYRLPASRVIPARLRQLFDEWNDTGRHEDESENQADRNVAPTSEGYEALERYGIRTPFRSSFNHKTMQREEIAGRLPYGVTALQFPVDSFQCAMNRAEDLFTELMESKWRDQLCKCRYSRCGVYFIRTKKNCRRLVHGTFCSPTHQRHASACAQTEAVRKSGKAKLIDAAANLLIRSPGKYSGWQDATGRRQALADDLCLKIAAQRLHAYHQSIKANWVYRHRREIEAQRLKLTRSRVETVIP